MGARPDTGERRPFYGGRPDELLTFTMTALTANVSVLLIARWWPGTDDSW
jgi:hypothetical protein